MNFDVKYFLKMRKRYTDPDFDISVKCNKCGNTKDFKFEKKYGFTTIRCKCGSTETYC